MGKTYENGKNITIGEPDYCFYDINRFFRFLCLSRIAVMTCQKSSWVSFSKFLDLGTYMTSILKSAMAGMTFVKKRIK